MEQFPYFSLVPSNFQSALSILAHVKLFCYCFVDFKAQLSKCFKFELLWHLLVENMSLCSLLLFFIFLYLEILNLFLCPVNDTGDGHFYFS